MSFLRRRLGGVFYGWWVVLGGMVTGALGGGIYFYGFTVFFLPLSAELGVSRAATSLAFSLSRAEGALGAPPVGWLIDRYGARKMLLLSTALAGIGYLLLSRVGNFSQFIIVYLVLVSVGFNLGFFNASMAAVNYWFVRRRGMAMSILMSSVGAGGAFVVPLLSLAVLKLGWREASVLSGLALLLIATPAALLVRHSPESMGLAPDGDPHPTPQAANPNPSPHGVDYTGRQAMGTSAFWLLTLAIALRVAAFGALVIHMVPILVWRGVDQQMAANLVGLLALFSIPFRLLSGWMGDRLGKQQVTAAALFIGGLSIPLLLVGTQMWHFYLFAALFAIADGVSPIAWALVGDFFGRRYFATIRGWMHFVYTWGMVALPVWAGWWYDRTQSYEVPLWLFTALFGAAALTFSRLRPPQPRDDP